MPPLRTAIIRQRRLAALSLVFAAATSPLGAQLGVQTDIACPAYPAEMRHQNEAAISRIQRITGPRRRVPLTYDSSQDVNFIDTQLFSRMYQDGVPSAGPATDAEFLRRVTLDLTGRIPSVQQVLDYTSSTDPGKSDSLIDRLLGSNEFIDYWTLWFGNTFQVTSQYYDFIGIPGRTLFYNFVRGFVASSGSYQDFATAMITGSGDTHINGAPNYLMRGLQYAQPVQDSYDEITNRVTTHFLGVQTTCISCHDGRGKLEQINLFLAGKARVDFWKQSAFFSRMNILHEAVDAAGSQKKGIVTDAATGGYNSVLADPNNPGPRPARKGGPYSPAYLFNGQTPQSGNWRQELARFVTGDRQFARAFVNYLWAHFYRIGIVDPPNAFDLARLDPNNPPADGRLQASNPALLEQLTDAFISSGYQLRPIMRLMVGARAYHLSSVYSGSEVQAQEYYAKALPRRLTAEEIYDAVITATNTPAAMTVEGIPGTLYYAGQLPDPSEPRSNQFDTDNYIRDFLAAFGRGDWYLTDRDNTSNPVLALTYMNSDTVTPRTFGNLLYFGNSLVGRLAASTTGDQDAVTQLALATLGRPPGTDEMSKALAYPVPDSSREEWLSDIQWVFLNETEFFFSH